VESLENQKQVFHPSGAARLKYFRDRFPVWMTDERLWEVYPVVQVKVTGAAEDCGKMITTISTKSIGQGVRVFRPADYTDRNASKGPFRGRILGRRTFSNFALIESAYAPNQYLSRHCHERAYISVALRGFYTERCGSTEWECDRGEAIFHAPAESHSDRFYAQGGRLLNLELLPHFLARLKDHGIDTGSRTRLASAYCMRLGLGLQREAVNPDPISELAIEGLGMELLAEVLRQRALPPVRRPSDWLQKVTGILHDRFRSAVTLTELANHVQVHPVHLARAFRTHHRCSVGDYLRKLRIEAACHELLNSEAPLVEIAARAGFSDQSHLCRILKRYTGMSPSQFRRDRSAC
jgi:AraC family transcriptional regulator